MACKGMLQPPAWLALSDCCPSQGLGPADHIQYGRISCLTGQVTGKPDPALAYKGRSGSQRTRWPALPKRAPSINKFRDAYRSGPVLQSSTYFHFSLGVNIEVSYTSFLPRW